jgi:hypothetical protein
MALDPRKGFRAHYESKSNSELIGIASNASSYIRVAREELAGELEGRGLPHEGIRPPVDLNRSDAASAMEQAPPLPSGFSTPSSAPAGGWAKVILGIAVYGLMAILAKSGRFGYVPASIIFGLLTLLAGWLLV